MDFGLDRSGIWPHTDHFRLGTMSSPRRGLQNSIFNASCARHSILAEPIYDGALAADFVTVDLPIIQLVQR